MEHWYSDSSERPVNRNQKHGGNNGFYEIVPARRGLHGETGRLSKGKEMVSFPFDADAGDPCVENGRGSVVYNKQCKWVKRMWTGDQQHHPLRVPALETYLQRIDVDCLFVTNGLFEKAGL